MNQNPWYVDGLAASHNQMVGFGRQVSLPNDLRTSQRKVVGSMVCNSATIDYYPAGSLMECILSDHR